jgi:hypothetical protein
MGVQRRAASALMFGQPFAREVATPRPTTRRDADCYDGNTGIVRRQLTILLVIGATASQQIVPVSAAIVLLLLVYFSYRQTIAAYPNGGGSYTVAKVRSSPRSRGCSRTRFRYAWLSSCC